MARLPQPGGDSGNWGDILNDYLGQVHKADGTLKDNSVGSSQLQDNAVTAATIANDAITATQIADGTITPTQLNSSVQTSLSKADNAYQKPSTGIPLSDMKRADLDGAYAQQLRTYQAISALKYGNPNDSTSNQTAAVQQVIDEVSAAGGGVIAWPSGIIVAEIVLKSNIRIIGQGVGVSTIMAPSGSSSRGVVTIDSSGGAVKRASISDISINGNGNANQWGIFIKGVASTNSPYDGGLWYSDFERMKITNTIPGGILMQGGPTSSLLPQQFLNFRSISIQLTTGTYPNWVGLRIAGQVGQVHFDQIECSYRGTNFSAGNNYGAAALYVSREIDDTGAIISDKYPYALKFSACTFQGCAIGARLDRVQGCAIDTSWFEDNQSGILFEQSTSSCVARDCTFADTGSNGASSGYIAKVIGSAFGEIDNPTIIGAFDSTWINSAGTGHLRINNAHNTSAVTSNYPKQFTAASTLILGSERYVAITGSTTVQYFTSYLDPDEILTVRALTVITLNGSAGNIRFPVGVADTTLSFALGSRLLFKWDKNGNIFTLLSTSSAVVHNGAYRVAGTGGGGYVEGVSQSTDPAAPPAAAGRIFWRTNASSKMEFCVRFPTGAVQVIATEP